MKRKSHILLMMMSIVIFSILGSCSKDDITCIPSTLECNWSPNSGNNWYTSKTPNIALGNSLQIMMGPDEGTWQWTGPNGFTASTRQIELSNITEANAGVYIVTNTTDGGCSSIDTITVSVVTLPSNSKVAYYAFDATPVDQEKLSLVDFTDNADIVVVFEGTLWEIADTVEYGNKYSYILTINDGPYRSYKHIIDDIHTLQSRGIKVLMNLDDSPSWQTTSPFNTDATYEEYAAMISDWCAQVPFDGIALDIEHFSGPANENWINLVRELGKYFGPLSSDPSTIYTAAIYSGAEAGDAIGKNTTTAAYFNFVMDMGYFDTQNINRFNQYADVIGAAKVMDGMSHQYNALDDAIAYVNWMKTIGGAGVMVFAGNVNKPYTDAIFAAVDAD